MDWNEAKEEAKAVKAGQSRSHIRAADKLAAWVLQQGDQSATILELEKQVAALSEAAQRVAALDEAEALMARRSDADVLKLEDRVKELEKANAEFAAFIEDSGDISATVRIATDGLKSLLTERWQLRWRVDELLADATKAKDNSLYRVVRRFHLKFGHPVYHTPKVPDDEQVRFRVALITEEFLELASAVYGPNAAPAIANVHGALAVINLNHPVVANLPEFYDAMIDLAWVIEGTHAVFGTMAEPGIAEVARANMAKDPVYVAAKDEHHRQPDPNAKPTKPEGWTPPDVKAVLRAQGWVEDEVRAEDQGRPVVP